MIEHHAGAETGTSIAQAFDEAPPEADLSTYALEDWLTFAIFWLLCGVVFLQFFTRYVLNDSASWTEEIARYLLVGVVFLGSAMCVRLDRHVQVDLLYRYLPRTASRVLVTCVDLLRVGFLGYAVWLAIEVTMRVGSQTMTMVSLPMGIIFGFVAGAFAVMCLRALILAIHHLRVGSSVLEAPTYDLPGTSVK